MHKHRSSVMKAMHILPSLDAERRISVTWGGSTFGLWRANSVRVAESSSQADEGGRRPAFLDPKDPASTASLTDLAVLSEEDEEGMAHDDDEGMMVKMNVDDDEYNDLTTPNARICKAVVTHRRQDKTICQYM